MILLATYHKYKAAILTSIINMTIPVNKRVSKASLEIYPAWASLKNITAGSINSKPKTMKVRIKQGNEIKTVMITLFAIVFLEFKDNIGRKIIKEIVSTPR
jgi:hypothetical protein